MSKHSQLLRFIALFLFAVSLLYQDVAASVQVRIFSLDNVEPAENNLVRLRFYIQNYGTEPLSNFTCYYYFTTESNKTPVCDDYYTPDASFSLENLTNGNYRVKFSFTGITINPGQSLPNPDGEAVGIHYSDWSALDKSNDFSNTGLKTFTLNGNMPVYNSDGTLIYGNIPSDPGTPPVPPRVVTNTALYAVLSKENTDIRDRVKVKGGCVGSEMYVDIGCDAVVNGDVYSGRSMFLRERDTIRGNAAAGEVVNKQNPNTVVVTGTVRSHAQLEIPQAATIVVNPGTKDTTVQNFGTIDLAPGSYRDFHAFSNSIVILHSGNYTFNTFVVEPDVNIICKIDKIERLNLDVQTELRFADRTIMDFDFGTVYPHSIKMYSAQTGMVFIGNDCQIYGDLVAPNAEVHLYSRTDFYGSIYGKKAVLEPEVIVCNPPLLIDLCCIVPI